MKFILLLALLVACVSIEVNVMLPLTMVGKGAKLNVPESTIDGWFDRLRSVGTDGVMLDAFWGALSTDKFKFDFSPIKTIVDIARRHGLKVQLVTSWHQLGGNVGDPVFIGLPQWILDVQKQVDYDIFYRDQWGHSDPEYVSLGVADKKIFYGKSIIDIYQMYLEQMQDQMKLYFQDGTINELQISLGPAGELRYPSYISKLGDQQLWDFPGVGAFMAWSEPMLDNLRSYMNELGHPEWTTPPTDAGWWSSKPWETLFFTKGYKSDYGRSFLSWYSQQLIAYGDKVLGMVKKTIKYNTQIAAKISGIHWQYNTDSHAAEVTAGYFNTDGQDGYYPILQMFNRHGVVVDFTCLEYRNNQIDTPGANSNPENLVKQVRDDAKRIGMRFSGENAIERFDQDAFDQAYYQSTRNGPIHAITWLRLSDNMLQYDNFNRYANFVKRMHNA
ncbi:hypothetical protein PCE1_003230 [Barthelona sp. PCE]